MTAKPNPYLDADGNLTDEGLAAFRKTVPQRYRLHLPNYLLEEWAEAGAAPKMRLASGTVKVAGEDDERWFHGTCITKVDAESYGYTNWLIGRNGYETLKEAKQAITCGAN